MNEVIDLKHQDILLFVKTLPRPISPKYNVTASQQGTDHQRGGSRCIDEITGYNIGTNSQQIRKRRRSYRKTSRERSTRRILHNILLP